MATQAKDVGARRQGDSEAPPPATSTSPQVFFTDEQLRNGPLRLRSSALVDEVHAISLRMLQGEDQREGRLDAKAQGLLITSGLSLTVTFTLGGMLLQHPEILGTFGKASWLLIGLYVLALLLGLLASIIAVNVLLVSNRYRSVSEGAVFASYLTSADDDYANEHAANSDVQRGNAKALANYRRHLTAHYWGLWQVHFQIHNEKGASIRRGQRFFLAFLCVMILVGAAMAWAAASRTQDGDPASTSAANENTAVAVSTFRMAGSHGDT